MTEDQVKELMIKNLKLKITYSDTQSNSTMYVLNLIYDDQVISTEYLDIDIPLEFRSYGY